MSLQPEQFVSEPIQPAPGAFDTAAMSRGEPGLPRQFTWRGHLYTPAQTLRTWKTSTRDRGELYLRRHWFQLLTATGETMTIYCERQTRNPGKPRQRWYLYTITAATPA